MPELASDYGMAWERFQQAPSIRLLQETIEGEWTRGRTDFVAFLIAVSDEDVCEYIRSTVRRIADIPGVEPYPEVYWHITVKGVGFLCDSPVKDDEVSPAEVQRIADAARGVLEATPAFEVRVGPPNVFPEVVFLEVPDGGVVRSLNKRLLAEVPGLKQYPVDGDVFLPHISIARFSSNEGIEELKRTLAPMREEPKAAAFTVREVLLIQARLSEEAPTFELLAQYKLS